jgi:hypothetical protein
MPRRGIQRSGEATPPRACVAAGAEPTASDVAEKDEAASFSRAAVAATLENRCVLSPPASWPRAAGPAHARRAGPRSPEPPFVATVSVGAADAHSDASETPEAAKPAPLDGDLIRRRWRSLIGRHPPKTISHALMDRILAWREQVAEGGDINPRSRAILAAALAGKAVGAGEDGQVRSGENKGDHVPGHHRPRAPIRVGTALFREHAGALHRVTVVAEGFEWEGRIFSSLSAVARAITGVRWNGHRFFALDRGARQGAARKANEQDAARPRPAAGEPNDPSHTGGGL